MNLFIEKLLSRTIPEVKDARLETPCRTWIGAKTSDGYGSTGIPVRLGLPQKTGLVHKIILEHSLGRKLDLDTEETDHICRNRACCEITHLRVSNDLKNTLTGDAGKHWREKTHCPKGHPYDEANTRIKKTARGGFGRVCRACGNEAAKEWKLNNPEKAKEYERRNQESRKVIRAGNRAKIDAVPYVAYDHREFCRNGHRWTPETTRIRIRKGKEIRECRICMRAVTANSKAKHRNEVLDKMRVAAKKRRDQEAEVRGRLRKNPSSLYD